MLNNYATFFLRVGSSTHVLLNRDLIFVREFAMPVKEWKKLVKLLVINNCSPSTIRRNESQSYPELKLSGTPEIDYSSIWDIQIINPSEAAWYLSPFTDPEMDRPGIWVWVSQTPDKYLDK